MYSITIGRVLRMLRIRKGWRQADVARKAGVSSSAVGRHENGVTGSLVALAKHAAVFGLRVDVRILGRAGALVRLNDEEHARIVEIVAAWFRARGFLTETEASYSEWGERGRIDLMSLDPTTGTLVIVEVKTLLLDLQDLFGALNVKERLARTIGDQRGWTVRRQVTVLAVASTSPNRAIVRGHPTQFAAFAARRLTVTGLADTARILHWVAAGEARRSWLAGRQRVTPKRGQLPRRGA